MLGVNCTSSWWAEMQGLWLRLGETATGRPAYAGRPRSARPALPHVFGAEPIMSFERELAEASAAEEAAGLGARPAPVQPAPPGFSGTETDLAIPPQPPAGSFSHPGPSRTGEHRTPLARQEDATAKPPPAARPGARPDSAPSGAEEVREVGAAHARAHVQHASQQDAADGRPLPVAARPATHRDVRLGTPLMAAPEEPGPGGTGIARPATPRAARPLRAAAGPAVATPGEATLSALSSGTGPAPPTVEIRIGRIEVRAVQAPSPRSHGQPKPAAPRVSLEDYLRARTAGR
jgi:hypothetical protein